MSSLPPTAVRAIVESERPGAVAWAARHGWALTLQPDDLVLRSATYHPAVHRLVEFVAHLDDYKALPPAWRVVVPGTDDAAALANFPKPGPDASIFHSNLVLCAPWNRLAYKSVNDAGPHNDWGGPEGWLNLGGNHTTAHTLGDMLASIDRFLRVSPGMMG